MIERALKPAISKLLSQFPAVVILGPSAKARWSEGEDHGRTLIVVKLIVLRHADLGSFGW